MKDIVYIVVFKINRISVEPAAKLTEPRLFLLHSGKTSEDLRIYYRYIEMKHVASDVVRKSYARRSLSFLDYFWCIFHGSGSLTILCDDSLTLNIRQFNSFPSVTC